MLTLVSLPDDALLLVIAACGDDSTRGVPSPLSFDAVKSLARLSKALLGQLRRLWL